VTLQEKNLFLLDMDGTIYLGDELIDGAKEFLAALKSRGKDYVFLTNNSSKSAKAYVKKLRGLGIEATEDEVFTSGEATTLYLEKEKPGARVYLLGTEALEEEFIRAGFVIEKQRKKKVDYVVLGFDTTLTYEKIWGACEYIARGVDYIATHPDFVCPLPNNEFMPDAGAMAAMIEAATGKTPKVMGKPNKQVVESVALKFGREKEDMVMVGDRLYTDVQTGNNAGIASAIVFSGETKKEDYGASPIRATFAYPSVKEMMEGL